MLTTAKMRSFLFSLSLCSILAVPASSQAPPKASRSDEASCRRFVQEFYAWYSPQALKEHAGRTSDVALRERGSSFSGELLKLLKEDSAAQSKADEIVGLDFDPFLASQDPADRYVVGKITRKGNSYWVEVSGIVQGKKSTQPDVVAELVPSQGRWIFVNFHYREGRQRNLQAILKSLAKERKDNPK